MKIFERRLEMTDATTNLIHDTFVRNRPANVGVQEAEELFARWLADHDFQAEAEPSAPDGFAYEPATSEPAGVPSDDEILTVAFAADTLANVAEMFEDMGLPADSVLQASIVDVVADIDCAVCHLAAMVDKYGPGAVDRLTKVEGILL